MVDVIFESAFQTRSTIADLVERGITDATVLSQLILNGTAISDEAVLWELALFEQLETIPDLKAPSGGPSAARNRRGRPHATDYISQRQRKAPTVTRSTYLI